MADPVSLLIVEDQETDVELMVRELRKQGFEPQWERVDTEEEFRAHVSGPFDAILTDANMPQFSARRALAIVREQRLSLPCIVVSGSIGEEEAVALVRAGATDYILKDRMARLGDAVRRVLQERTLRTQVKQAEHDLYRLNQELELRIAERTLELEAANEALARELAERRDVEERLRQLASTLEQRVTARTQELARSYERLRALASDLTVAEQTERRRLASELHDYLAQLLVVARMKMSRLRRDVTAEPHRTILEETDQVLIQSLDYTRSLVAKLTPQALYERGLGAALHWLADQIRRQQGFDVVVSLEAPELPLREADAVLLFQSVRELIFNVIKHGQTDRVWVSMQYTDEMLTIEVRDEGIGFDVQAVHDDPRDMFGLLSIRERMTALGGRFELRSSPGKGTMASIHFPFTCAGEPAAAGGPPGQTSATPLARNDPAAPGERSQSLPSGTLRVLVVDDNDVVREGLCMVLERYEDLAVVGQANSGEEALELVPALVPDVVIMDMRMPGVTGAETTRRILRDHPATVVIGLSIEADQEVARAMLEAGASAFLTKDTVAGDLYAAIRTFTAARGCQSSPAG